MTEVRLTDVLRDMLSGTLREVTRGQGPVKWCRACGRKHPRRAGCGLATVHVPASSGRMVERQVQRSRAS